MSGYLDPDRKARLEAEAHRRSLALPFPDWIERLRAMPNALLRSALFGVIRPGRRKFVKEMLLPVMGGLALTYTGERLDQGDEDVFMQIVHYARGRKATDVISFPKRRLLREIGRGVGKSDYDWLHQRLVALSSCGMVITEIATRRRIYSNALLLALDNPGSDELAFKLNPYLRPLFESDQFTMLDWDDRLALGNKPLVKWLHGFYASHVPPYGTLKVASIKNLCGSEAKDLNDFRRDLKRALGELKARRLIRAWRIDAADVLHVTVCPSRSQARHLALKAGGETTG